MNKKTVRIIKYTLLSGVLVFIFTVFYPRSYDVPEFKTRVGTQYWQLSTGSQIGYTIIAGKGEKKETPIIYLHGGPGGYISNRDIQALTPIADSGYNVYLYDQTGSGESERLKDIDNYTVARHIEDLDEIIKKIGAKKVILIGQSWGAILAALYIADNPDKIEKIIFTSPGPIYPVRKELANNKVPDSIHLRNPFFTNAMGNKKVNNIRTKTMKWFATSFGMKLASNKEADEFETLLDYELNRSTVCDTSKIPGANAGGGYYASIMTYNSLLKIQDPRPKLKELKTPVLIMKGECDNQKWGFTNEYKEVFQNSELVIVPAAGHFISEEQPGLYIKTIQQFLIK
jgi:proline iminopeptidase